MEEVIAVWQEAVIGQTSHLSFQQQGVSRKACRLLQVQVYLLRTEVRRELGGGGQCTDQRK